MKIAGKVLTLVLFAITAMAWGRDCNSMVNDEAGILHAPQALTEGARSLIDEFGCEIRVRKIGERRTYVSSIKDLCEGELV